MSFILLDDIEMTDSDEEKEVADAIAHAEDPNLSEKERYAFKCKMAEHIQDMAKLKTAVEESNVISRELLKTQKSLLSVQGELRGDILELKEAEKESAAVNREVLESKKVLTESQKNLNTTLEGISANLHRGFTLGERVIALFGRIVMVFLLVVVGLVGVIVYVTGLDINYGDSHMKTNKKFNHGEEVQEAPKVDFEKEEKKDQNHEVINRK